MVRPLPAENVLQLFYGACRVRLRTTCPWDRFTDSMLYQAGWLNRTDGCMLQALGRIQNMDLCDPAECASTVLAK